LARVAIDSDRRCVWIEATSSLHPIHTRTEGLEGYLDLDARRDGRIDLTVTPKARLSLPVDRLRSGNVLEDREMKRRINARRYRTIEGELSEMQALGDDGRYRVRGEIPFRGVTNEHEDDMHLSFVDEDTIAMTGESTFDIRDYGMEPPRILMLRVEPEVKVRVEIVAARQEE